MAYNVLPSIKMLPNPVLKNTRNKIVYFTLWSIVCIVQLVLINNHMHLGALLPYFAVDVVLFEAPLAFLLLYTWIPVNTITWSGSRWYAYAMVHLVMALGFFAVSICVNKILMFIIASGVEEYWHLMEKEFTATRFFSSIMTYLVIVLCFYLYIFIKRLQEKQINEIRLNQIIKTNELELLKSQINPHFLFNSLNSLNSLILNDTQQAQRMLLALADYLRYVVLSNNNIYTTLQQEISNSERYLSIEKLRYGERLLYNFNIPQYLLHAQMPSMLLQPLFENAVKYNVYESLQQVEITANAVAADDNFSLIIANSHESSQAEPHKGAGTGLHNIRERLHLLYDDKAWLHTQIKDGKFIATLRLPLLFKK